MKRLEKVEELKFNRDFLSNRTKKTRSVFSFSIDELEKIDLSKTGNNRLFFLSFSNEASKYAVHNPYNKNDEHYIWNLPLVVVFLDSGHTVKLISNQSNCQLATVEGVQQITNCTPTIKKGVEVLKTLLTFFDKTHYFFHIRRDSPVSRVIEKLYKENDEFELVYNHEIPTYASTQNHILIRFNGCSAVREDESLSNEDY